MHDQVAGSGADAELRVVADRRVGRVEREEKVGHPRAVPKGRFESGGPQSLAPDRSVDVGDAEEDETAVVCFHPLGFVQHSLRRPRFRVDGAHSFCLTAFSTAAMLSANRATICFNSSSVLVYAGARTTSSPANPSGVGWVELTSSPCSNATS